MSYKILIIFFPYACHDKKNNVSIREYVFNFIQQKSPTFISGEMNANRYEIQWGFKLRLNKVKASGEPFDFQRKFIEQARRRTGRPSQARHADVAI
jgi:hypothetical protein